MLVMDTDNHINNTSDKPWLWKKGVSANPAGRPKGKTMKEYCREYLACMNEEERQDFMNGLPKELIWKMSEGNPKQDTDITSGGEKLPTPILNINRNGSNTETKI